MSDVANIITAITALAAVIIGPFISIRIARREIHASVVSSNRQAWINALRDCIADYLSKQAVARNLNALHHADGSSLARVEEIVRLTNRIELLINPKERDHAELVRAIGRMTETLNQQNAANQAFDVNAAQRQVIDLSQSILKREWERVKCGE